MTITDYDLIRAPLIKPGMGLRDVIETVVRKGIEMPADVTLCGVEIIEV